VKNIFKVIILVLFVSIPLDAAEKIVRLPIKTYGELEYLLTSTFQKDQIPEIAAGRPGEWYDLIVDDYQLNLIKSTGIDYQIIIEDLNREKEKVKDSYHSYTNIVEILRTLSNNYANIAKIESIGPTYERRWIYGLKISDNVLEDEEEPEQLFSGVHHAREWATAEVCLFIADSLLRSYGTDPTVTSIVNNREIWIFPVINVDGYVYDYSIGGDWWRKNRELYASAIGTDLNRNYNGICDTAAIDGWGYINSNSVSHYPSGETFCGKHQSSAYEINKYAEFIKSRHFLSILDYHSYAEVVLVPWSHKYTATPHDDWYNTIGQQMAQMISRLGGGYYTYQRSIDLYPSSGSSSDWQYGWNIYVNGTPCFALTIEMGTAFYQDASDLPFLKRENFDAAFYLLQKGDSILNYMKGFVPAPIIISPEGDTISDTLKIEWQVPNSSFNQPSSFEIQMLKGPSLNQEGFESTSDLWVRESFSTSTQMYHGGTKSLYSGSANYIAAQARTKYPYLVQNEDSFSLWIYYNTEQNYDVGIIEISENLREWMPLDNERFTGASQGWVRKAYDLTPYTGKSVYFRIRYMTDGAVLNSGIYIDDVFPVVSFDSIWTISPISDTLYILTDLEEGEYYFRVRGSSAAFGFGNYSNLKKIYVTNTQSGQDESTLVPFLVSNPQIIKGNLVLLVKAKDPVISVYDPQGRLVYTHRKQGIVDSPVEIPLSKKGIYFYSVEAASGKIRGKIVKIN